MKVKHGKPDKLPLICRMCKARLVKYFCKVCPAQSSTAELCILKKISTAWRTITAHKTRNVRGIYPEQCAPLSVQDLPMTEEEAHALNVQMRYDEEAKGIVSNVDPETRKYFAGLKKKMGIP